MTSPGAISNEYMEQLLKESDLLSRAKLAGRYVDYRDMCSEEAQEALSKSLDESSDDWWGDVAQRWVGL